MVRVNGYKLSCVELWNLIVGCWYKVKWKSQALVIVGEIYSSIFPHGNGLQLLHPSGRVGISFSHLKTIILPGINVNSYIYCCSSFVILGYIHTHTHTWFLSFQSGRWVKAEMMMMICTHRF